MTFWCLDGCHNSVHLVSTACERCICIWRIQKDQQQLLKAALFLRLCMQALGAECVIMPCNVKVLQMIVDDTLIK